MDKKLKKLKKTNVGTSNPDKTRNIKILKIVGSTLGIAVVFVLMFLLLRPPPAKTVEQPYLVVSATLTAGDIFTAAQLSQSSVILAGEQMPIGGLVAPEAISTDARYKALVDIPAGTTLAPTSFEEDVYVPPPEIIQLSPDLQPVSGQLTPAASHPSYTPPAEGTGGGELQVLVNVFPPRHILCAEPILPDTFVVDSRDYLLARAMVEIRNATSDLIEVKIPLNDTCKLGASPERCRLWQYPEEERSQFWFATEDLVNDELPELQAAGDESLIPTVPAEEPQVAGCDRGGY